MHSTIFYGIFLTGRLIYKKILNVNFIFEFRRYSTLKSLILTSFLDSPPFKVVRYKFSSQFLYQVKYNVHKGKPWYLEKREALKKNTEKGTGTECLYLHNGWEFGGKIWYTSFSHRYKFACQKSANSEMVGDMAWLNWHGMTRKLISRNLYNYYHVKIILACFLFQD